jgi:hypothetical protein
LGIVPEDGDESLNNGRQGDIENIHVMPIDELKE